MFHVLLDVNMPGFRLFHSCPAAVGAAGEGHCNRQAGTVPRFSSLGFLNSFPQFSGSVCRQR